MSINSSSTEDLKQFPDQTSISKFAQENATEVIVKCEPMETISPEQIKTEVADELYKEHEIKEEMAIGPVVLQGGSVQSSGGDNNKMTKPPDYGSFVAVKQEPEDVIVKSEQEGAVSSVKIEVPDLYEEHEVKQEMVIGPVMLQKSSVVGDVTDAVIQSYPDIDNCKMSKRNFYDEDVTTPSAHTYNTVPDPRESQEPLENKEYNDTTCKVCNKKYKTKKILKRHEVIHMDALPFVCDYCKKGYKCRGFLVNHIRQHTGEYKFKCKICEEKFYYRRNFHSHLQTHIEANSDDVQRRQQTHNTEGERVCCGICHKQMRLSSLSRHYEMHENIFKHDYDKQFHKKKNFQGHLAIHTGTKPFPCDVCDKEFSYQWGLKRHKATHTGVRPFPCDICNKRFFDKCNLTRHMEIHTRIKQFECEICHNCYSKKSTLLVHQLTHAGYKPYGCDMCGKHFRHKCYIKKHMYRCPKNRVRDSKTKSTSFMF